MPVTFSIGSMRPRSATCASRAWRTRPNALEENRRHLFHDALAWEVHLYVLKIKGPRHRQIATEGALLGALAVRGLHERLAVVSDDASKFNVLRRALYCIHAERLIPKPVLRQHFDALFMQKTRYKTLNQLLRRLDSNKAELLLVLERPEIPLHTNDSERDIRDYVKKRKVSGGTRSDLGRQCRDTFISLKKTCRKLGLSFWLYLNDRITQANRIPFLPAIIETRAAPS